MQLNDYYMSLPYDLSGSRTKNRFRIELLWGIIKLLEIYDNDEFIIVFDYVCDIEIHYNDKLEFYQLKSHKGIKQYTAKEITEKGKHKNSILGKLFILRKEGNNDIKLAIVSNGYLKEGTKIIDGLSEFELSNLETKNVKFIQDAIKKELNIDDVDLSNVYFIHTNMDLVDPVCSVKGKLVSSFEKIKGCEPKKPNAFYQMIYDVVNEKACYEVKVDNYDDLIDKKGITKREFNKMLDLYVDKIDKSVEMTQKYISKFEGIKERKSALNELTNLLNDLLSNKEIQYIEREIAQYICQNIDNIPQKFEDCVECLKEKFRGWFSIEYNSMYQHVCIVLILNRYMEGGYDNETNV